jgi:hypothetical protein
MLKNKTTTCVPSSHKLAGCKALGRIQVAVGMESVLMLANVYRFLGYSTKTMSIPEKKQILNHPIQIQYTVPSPDSPSTVVLVLVSSFSKYTGW